MVMAAASMPATELMRMSRCSTWPNSCATTPSISVSLMRLQDAGGDGHRGVRRVAAGGEGVGRVLRDEPEFGHGQTHPLAEAPHDRRDSAYTSGFSVSLTGCAEYDISAILSEKK
jgi:hypothetical protein